MFEKFTDRARRVVVLAQEEARVMSHSYIGTEHQLLGLIHEGEGIAAVVLNGLGVKLDPVREQLAEIIGQGTTPSPPASLPFTPRAKKVFELALREGLQLGHNYIATEHILLGMIREGEGVGCQIIAKLGVSDLQQVREAVIHAIAGTINPKYVQSPGPNAVTIDASLPGTDELLAHGWTLVQRFKSTVTCQACGVAHLCDRFIEVTP